MCRYDEYPVPSIAQLLEELCPDGVPTVPLGGYAKRNRATNITAGQMAKLNTPDGDTLVFAAGSTKARINAQDHPGTHVTTLPSVIVKSRGYVDFEYCDEPFTHKAELWSYHSTCDDLNMKYLFYFLSSQKTYFQGLARANAVKLPQLKVADTDDFGIPLPPPEVQEQVVDILDMFTDLGASLNRELALRETQIEVCLGDIFASDEIANSHSVPLGHLLRHIQPGKYQVNSTEYDPSAPTPVLSPGKAFLLGYTDETDGIFEASPDDPAIIFDDFTTNFHWVDFPFKVKSSAMKMLVPRSDDFVFRYAYWAMKTIPYKPTEHQRQWLQTYSRFEIPLPPLDVQERIVDPLDMFTDYTDNLRREIELRRQQLGYYRDQLLTFPAAE